MNPAYIKFVKAKNKSEGKAEEVESIPAPEDAATSKAYLQIVATSSKPSPALKQPKLSTTLAKIVAHKPNSIFTFCQQNRKKETTEWIEQFGGDRLNQLLDDYKWTPLMVAATAGHVDIVAILLKAGARCDDAACFPDGQTLRQVCRKRKHYKVLKVIDRCLKEEKKIDVPEEQVKPTNNNNNNKVNTTITFECATCKQTITDCKTQAEHEASIVHQLAGQRFSRITSAMTNFAHLDRDENRGYRLLQKAGWSGTSGLGRHEQGRKFPLIGQPKPDRNGLGFKDDDDDDDDGGGGNKKIDTTTSTTRPTKVSAKVLNKRARLRQQQRERAIEANFRKQFHEH